MPNADYKVVLEDICLDVRRVRVAPAVINSYAAVLLCGKSAKYPLHRTDVFSFSVSQAATQYWATLPGSTASRINYWPC